MASFIFLFTLMVTAYLLGAIPWGLILTRRVTGRDLRDKGSGNIGATNVARVVGNTLGALTLFLDMLKGGLPVYLAGVLSPYVDLLQGEIVVSLVGLCAILGHLYPVYLGFKTGGKGVATTAGCFLMISPEACAAACLVFCLVFAGFRRVSAASLGATASLPVFIAIWGNSVFFTVTAVLSAILIFIRHTGNIKRLLNGTEPVFEKRPRR
ncbi:MAG: glycerol-3-phosphate 1-O-acyltransferase PlsY [Desulfobacterales bacterium]|jgi:glycerol-3-phosphate acyltransferase PlsY|nr:glycerol-3-phosphate 1-O-acyltransferase PlsY [Desulfobacterales bacterium]